MIDVVDGRPNVIARIGKPGGRNVMLNGHLDVVGVEAMVHAPFDPVERDGRMYGRGSTDMKSGIAAMCAAAARVGPGLEGEVIVAAVIDEEYTSKGTRALIESGVRADMVIITEPTRLAICPAHRGQIWLDIEFHGRAAHGSRWDLGVDAVAHAGLYLAELDRHDREKLPNRPHHKLLGRASTHAGRIEGGVGYSTYPASCRLQVERRTLPSENADVVVAELASLADRARERNPRVNATVSVRSVLHPSDVAEDAPIVSALRGAIAGSGLEPRVEGLSAWTDAALFNAAGMQAVCFGPGDITLAHAAEEYVEVREIGLAENIIAAMLIGTLSG
jgi:acetylornithine deacetylase